MALRRAGERVAQLVVVRVVVRVVVVVVVVEHGAGVRVVVRVVRRREARGQLVELGGRRQVVLVSGRCGAAVQRLLVLVAVGLRHRPSAHRPGRRCAAPSARAGRARGAAAHERVGGVSGRSVGRHRGRSSRGSGGRVQRIQLRRQIDGDRHRDLHKMKINNQFNE